MKQAWQRLRLRVIAFQEGAIMLKQLIFANRQKFGGRWFSVEEVLVTLAMVYNIAPNREGWIRRVFVAAYREQHGRFAAESPQGQQRIDVDLKEYEERGELPFYVMRQRLECVSAQLVQQEES